MTLEEWLELFDEVGPIGPQFSLDSFIRRLELKIVGRAIKASKTVAGAARLLGFKRTSFIYRFHIKREDLEVKAF